MNKVLDWVDKRIYHCKDFLENSEPVDGAESYYEEQLEIAEEIKEMAEKATPKKVILHYKNWSTSRVLSAVICPSCKIRLKEGKRPNYCHKCGQHLDYSEFSYYKPLE